MEKLTFEPRLDSSNITVSVQGDHDIIVLGGTVASYNEKFIAEKAVQSLAHLRSIVNEIEVDLDTNYKKSDVAIANEITHALKAAVSIPHEHNNQL
jgi:osmotically-inducible protein OsmY